MELSDIRTEVRDRAGLDSSDAMLTDAVLTRLINASLREVSNIRDWDWLMARETISTVVGTTVYDRAADAKTSTRLTVPIGEDTRLLRLVTPRAAAAYERYSGRPAVWYVQAGQIFIYPKPSKVYDLTHDYIATETALANATDEPLIPDYAIDLVIIKAAMKVTARTDNTSQHRLLADEERDVLASLTDDARRSKGAPMIDIRRDWAS